MSDAKYHWCKDPTKTLYLLILTSKMNLDRMTIQFCTQSCCTSARLQNGQRENGISKSFVFRSKAPNSFKYWVDHHMHEHA